MSSRFWPTPTERYAFVLDNIKKQCSAPGCCRPRAYTWKYCERCHARARRTGDPFGRNFLKRCTDQWAEYANMLLEPFRQENHPAIVAAEKWIDWLLSQNGASVGYARPFIRELIRLRSHGVKPSDVLDVVCGMRLYLDAHPDHFPSLRYYQFRTFAV